MRIKIFVCFHKKDFVIDTPPYIPIQVGKANAKVDLGMIGDDTGDNISDKNPWYCELTAQYWIWKNCKDADYVGLCHYRRYLDFCPSFFYQFRPYIHSDLNYLIQHTSLPESKLSDYDVIIPSQRSLTTPLYDSLCMSHVKADVDILGDVVSELYPEYKMDYDKVIKVGNKYTPCNILFAKKKIFDDYSKWLFDILFEFEKKLTVPMSPYQPRLMGYYSERLLYVFLHHHPKYKKKHLPMILVDDEKNKPLFPLLLRETLRFISCLLYKSLD